jgi:hypothetical protein
VEVSLRLRVVSKHNTDRYEGVYVLLGLRSVTCLIRGGMSERNFEEPQVGVKISEEEDVVS